MVVGNFTSFDGLTQNRVLRLNPDGSLDSTINFGTGANNYVSSVRIQPWDGQILVGGSFTDIDGIQRQSVARLNGGGNGDGPGVFEFSTAIFSAREESTNTLVTVIRRQGLTGNASVELFTTNDVSLPNLAIEGASGDYIGLTNTLQFVSGQSLTNIARISLMTRRSKMTSRSCSACAIRRRRE